MELDVEKMVTNAVFDGLRKGVVDRLGSYNSPLEKLINDAIQKHSECMRGLLEGAIASCVKDEAFVDEIRGSVRTHLAKSLVQRFGGEIEKQVNALKSDPTTRARITLAIEDIVKSRAV